MCIKRSKVINIEKIPLIHPYGNHIIHKKIVDQIMYIYIYIYMYILIVSLFNNKISRYNKLMELRQWLNKHKLSYNWK